MNEKQPTENDGINTTTAPMVTTATTTVTTVTQQTCLTSPTQSQLQPLPGANIQSIGLSNWPFNGQDDQDLYQEALIPPENFNMVCEHVYRSSFPKKKHFRFLQKLKLKSVLTLILEDYPEQNMKFLEQEGIKFLQFGIAGNKEPFVQIPEDKISAALAAILDKRNHPMLIHCNKGKHRTGCLIGCLRKLQNWSHTSIFDEYRRFSHPKSRSMDQQFIELYDANQVWSLVNRKYLPRWPTLADPLL